MKQDPRFEAFAENIDVQPHYTITVQPIPESMEKNDDWPAVLKREDTRITAYMDVDLLPDINVSNLLIVTRAAELFLERDAFVLHASYVYHNGEAILFSAPCETGKSTQAHFWQQERGAFVVNEDRVLVYCHEGKFYAGGIWATGSAGVTHNVTAPIRAIILLGQGPENRVTVPGVMKRLQTIMSQSTYDVKNTSAREKLLLLLCTLVDRVKILGYDCINHPSSVEDLEAYLYE